MHNKAGLRSRPSAVPPRGRLLVVTCADAGRLEVLLRAASGHLKPRLSAEFVFPLATCQLAAGGGTHVKPSQFSMLAGAGALFLSWRVQQHSYGYSRAVLDRLAASGDVVLGAPVHMEPTLRAVWPDTVIVRLAAGTELLRHNLAPQATVARAAAAGSRHGLQASPCGAGFDLRVEDSTDPAVAVRRLASAIAAGLPIRPMHCPDTVVARAASGAVERKGRPPASAIGDTRPASALQARRRAPRSNAPVLG